jgi:hypothetical protein
MTAPARYEPAATGKTRATYEDPLDELARIVSDPHLFTQRPYDPPAPVAPVRRPLAAVPPVVEPEPIAPVAAPVPDPEPVLTADPAPEPAIAAPSARSNALTADFEAELFEELRIQLESAVNPGARPAPASAPAPSRIEPVVDAPAMEPPIGAFEPVAPSSARVTAVPETRFDFEPPARPEPRVEPTQRVDADHFDPVDDPTPSYMVDPYEPSYRTDSRTAAATPSDGDATEAGHPASASSDPADDPYDPRRYVQAQGYDPTAYRPANDVDYDDDYRDDAYTMADRDDRLDVRADARPVPAGEADDYYATDPRHGPDGALPELDDPEAFEEPVAASPRRGMLVAGVALGMVLIGGLGFLGYRAFSPSSPMASTSGQPPVIRADTRPIKTSPDPAQQPHEAQPAAKIDYSRAGTPVTDGKIVARQEEPVSQVAGQAGQNIRVILPGAPGATTPVDPAVDENSRRVRTVVVRPDGTIVPASPPATSTPTPSAPAATAPTAPSNGLIGTSTPATPSVPLPGTTSPVPSTTTTTTALPPLPATPSTQPPAALPPVAAVEPPKPAAPAQPRPQPTTVTPPAVTTAPTTTAAPPVAPPQPRLQATQTQPRPVQTQPQATAPAQPLPLVASQRPATGAPLVLAPNGQTPAVRPATPQTTAPQTAALAPAVPTTPGTPAATNSGSGQFTVQISAQRSEAEARAAYAAAQRRFGATLSGQPLNIQTADLGARGTFYRVRVGSMNSREEAVRLCEQLRSQGGDCVVARR